MSNNFNLRNTQDDAFVLHARPYRDTSLLLELFTLNRGRISAISRGVRKKGSKLSGLLLPFVPIAVFLTGKFEILNITKVELNGLSYSLTGQSLLSGFYLNELLVRLLPKHDAHASLYYCYAETLCALHQNKSIDNLQRQRLLRLFEVKLLQELGYGIRFDIDACGEKISADEMYDFKFGVGFTKNRGEQSSNSCFAGSNLIALYNDNLISAEDYRTAKRLLQLCLSHLLHSKPIKTRELF